MIEIGINNLTKYYGAAKIFENISFEIKTGERIGFIGQNGCGKTTVFKILMGMEDYQDGDISFRKDIRIGYLNQIPVYDENVTTIEVIRMAFEKIFHISEQMKELEHRFEHLQDTELEKAISSYGKLSSQYELLGGYEFETKINKITEGLQITEELKLLPFQSLSGGEKTRVILGKLLLEEPDVLLLDEPTNHLDLETLDWLENFLKEYRGSVLIISHDRYFLDRVVDRIIEMGFNQAIHYEGNYSFYVIEKERRFLIDYKHYQNQQKKIEQMENQIKRYRIWGAMRDSEDMYKRAKELEKRLEKTDVLDRPNIETKKIKIGADIENRTGKQVLQVEDVSKYFDQKTLLKQIDFNIYYQDRVCIIGKNGCGKSTLLKLILGELELDSGMIKLGSQVKIGYLPQHIQFGDEEQTILEYFLSQHQITNEAARKQLAKVLFYKEDVFKKIKNLSGGEKSRLKLCSLTFEKVNFMILDEPTNHLDVDSREVLEETLAEYKGTLLFVSHDRYFIQKAANKIIEITEGTVQIYHGDYSYYLTECSKRKEETFTVIDKKQSKKPARKIERKTDTLGNSDKEMKQNNIKIERLEEKIKEWEIKLKSIEDDMYNNSTDAEYLTTLQTDKESIEKELEVLYDEWVKALR